MRIGMVGLGRMGANMVTRLLRGGHQVVVFDRSADAVRTSGRGGRRGRRVAGGSGREARRRARAWRG
jgi:6-phosphogluconate dehydrogenase (decarboxylating)